MYSFVMLSKPLKVNKSQLHVSGTKKTDFTPARPDAKLSGCCSLFCDVQRPWTNNSFRNKHLQLSRNIGLMKATFRCTRLFCHPLRKTDNSVWRNLTCRVKLKRISILKHPDKEIILSLEKMF